MSGSNVYFKGKWQSQTFTTSGTFTVPDNVELVWVEMYGGGGGGAFATPDPGGTFSEGGQGANPVTEFVSVTPNTNISVTIGGGGSAGTSGNPGANGDDSSFGSINARGGLGGRVLGPFGGWFKSNGTKGLAGTGTFGTDSYTGGSGSLGNGGNGRNGGTPGTDGGIGAGGGGGGGNGGNGICIIRWKKD